MIDAVILSDIHLGSTVCQAKRLVKFIHSLQNSKTEVKMLIINGDIFDSWDLRRLCKNQWKVLSALRKLSSLMKIVWINGNHDGPIETISMLLGIEVKEEIIFQSGNKNILVLHGHQFDNFISDHPLITHLADVVYTILQKIHIYWAKEAKRYSKTFLRCSEQIEKKAKVYAHKLNCDVVCCGHTHLEYESVGEISYYNSGCWTELPCSYLVVQKGQVKVQHFDEKNNENYNSD